MADQNTYPHILADILAIFFVAAAIYHLSGKAGLPADLAASERLVFNGTSLVSSDEVEFASSFYRIGDQVEIAPLPGTPPTAVTLVPYYARPLVVFDAFTALVLISLGMFVAAFRRRDTAATVFHIASLTIAVATIGTKTIFSVRPAWLGYALCMIFSFAYTTIPALFAHFTLVFPTVRKKNYRILVTSLYAAAAVIAVWSGVVYLRAAGSGSIELFRRSATSSMIQNAFAVIVIVYGIFNFVAAYRSTRQASDRKKIRWLLYGLTFGPAPFILLWALPETLGYTPLIAEWIVKLFLLLIPTTFAISIVRHHLMDIDLLINRSLVYGIVIAAGGVFYVVMLIVAMRIINEFTHETSIIVSTVAAALFALAFAPAQRRVQKFVDRQFFRVQYDFRESLRTITEELKQCLDIRQIANLLVHRVDEVLPVTQLGFFTLKRPAYRLQLVEHKGFDVLAAHGTRFEVEKLHSSLNLPVALEEKMEPGIAFEPAEAGVFRRWGMALIFPLLSQQKEILGFLVLGEKKSGMRFTVEDVDLLVPITAQAGLAIERLALQEKLLLEQAESQRLEELNRLKSYFVSSVSHDLKTPLTSIRMFAEILRSGQAIPRERTKEYLGIIEGESERLTRLINNVLDFAKIERGVQEYRFADVDLHQLIHRTLCSLEYQFKMEKVKVTTSFCEGKPHVSADPDALTEALINLLTNAMKYSREVKEIAVSTFMRDGRIGIRIADRGIGIAAVDLEHIFEPFFRAREGKTHGAGGAGLGLSLVKHITNAHGGAVEVESRPGAGSAFTILLPLKEHHESSQTNTGTPT